jgi:hypothetical protein
MTAPRAPVRRSRWQKCLKERADRAFYAELAPNDRLVALLAHSTAPLACFGHLDRAWSQADAALAEARGLSAPRD